MALCVSSPKHGGRSSSQRGEHVLARLSAIDEIGFYCDLVRVSEVEVDVNNRCCLNGMTALMIAAREGDFEMLQTLCDLPETDLNLQNNMGWTALMFAADRGHESIARHLIRFPHVDLNRESIIDGATALILATARGHEQVVQCLLEREDIDLNKQNVIGWTALMLASFENHHAIAHMLLEKDSIDLMRQNKAGVTSVKMAAMQGNIDIVWMSLFKGATCVGPQHFPDASQQEMVDELTRRATQIAHLCRQLLEKPTWSNVLPNAVLVKILAMAFGDGLIVLGPNRGNLLAIEKLLSDVASHGRQLSLVNSHN